MYIHIGGSYQIPDKMIIGIFDIYNIDAFNPKNKLSSFIKKKEDDFLLELIEIDVPKTLILTLEKAYLSPISYQTLKIRLEKIGKYSYMTKKHKKQVKNKK